MSEDNITDKTTIDQILDNAPTWMRREERNGIQESTVNVSVDDQDSLNKIFPTENCIHYSSEPDDLGAKAGFSYSSYVPAYKKTNNKGLTISRWVKEKGGGHLEENPVLGIEAWAQITYDIANDTANVTEKPITTEFSLRLWYDPMDRQSFGFFSKLKEGLRLYKNKATSLKEMFWNATQSLEEKAEKELEKRRKEFPRSGCVASDRDNLTVESTHNKSEFSVDLVTEHICYWVRKDYGLNIPSEFIKGIVEKAYNLNNSIVREGYLAKLRQPHQNS